ncbi:protein VTS1 [Diplocarpon rosae]|nr:protein VTS1 [Diplocarpon rosae]
MYLGKTSLTTPLFTNGLGLPEISELEHELKELRKWTCMLNELQHTAVIVQMIQETSVSQIRVLMEAMILREAELTDVEPLTAGYSPSSTHSVDSGVWHSPGSVSSTTTRTTVSSNRSISRSPTRIHIPVAHHKNKAPVCQSSHEAIPSPQCKLFPTSLRSRAAGSCPSAPCPTTSPSTAVQEPARDDEAQTNAQLDLIRLTTGLPLTGRLTLRRRRKAPAYPRDERDPRWLFNWLYELRLHKYLPKLQGLTPRDLLELEGKEVVLIERGIASVGARRKLLRSLREANEQIRESDELRGSEQAAD